MCTTKGFTFVYAHESEDAVDAKIALGRNEMGQSKAVVALHTSGERRVYESSKEAAAGIGVSPASVSKFLTGRSKTPMSGWIVVLSDKSVVENVLEN